MLPATAAGVGAVAVVVAALRTCGQCHRTRYQDEELRRKAEEERRRKAEEERRAAHDAQQAAAHEAFMESMRASSAAQDAQFTDWYAAECMKDAEAAECLAREELERQERYAREELERQERYARERAERDERRRRMDEYFERVFKMFGLNPDGSVAGMMGPMDRAKNCMKILGLEDMEFARLSQDTLKKAYRKRALQTHPDKGGDVNEFRAVQDAYDELAELVVA
jgi:hypothetical protein